MISIAKYREMLGEKSAVMSDEQLEKLRELQYQLADLIIDLWIKRQKQSTMVDNSDFDESEKS